MLLALVLLLLTAVVTAVLGRRIGRQALLLGAAAPAAVAVWLVTRAPAVLDGEVATQEVSWVPSLHLTFTFRLDALGLLLGLLITGVGALVLVYAARYLGDGPRAAVLGALLLVFATAMLGLIWCDELLASFVFWEATTVTSFALVGFQDRREASRSAAWRTLMVTGAGGLALLGGIVALGTATGVWARSGLADLTITDELLLVAAAVGILLGAATKSAQLPFHGWLLGAMAAPTPVSAYLHSATMVTAGVWLVIVMSPALGQLALWQPALLVVGGLTTLLTGWWALSAADLKRLLAYSTVSALGAMVTLVGVGTPEAIGAAIAFLVAHGCYKAALFMAVGVVDHETGTRDLRRLGGLARAMPILAVGVVAALASMAALPATFGFVAKEAGVVASLDDDTAAGWAGLVALIGTGALAVAYGWRFWRGAFGAHRPVEGQEPAAPHGRPGRLLVAPAVVLGAVGVVLGVAPALLDGLVGAAVSAVGLDPGDVHLVAFPGISLALGVSALTIGLGAALAALLGPPELRVRPVGERSQAAFGRGISGFLRGAGRFVGVIQPGSLPTYLAIILTIAALPATAALAGGTDWPDWPVTSSWLQGAAALGVVVGTLAVARQLRRFAAVLSLGAVGLGIAGLFWAGGAPDLALTQVVVETVVVVAFVLVFRELPDEFAPIPSRRRAVTRAVVATTVGVATLVLLGLTMASPPVGPPAGRELVPLAEPDGGGLNVVNVIITDDRSLDTMGEITVIAVAALGVLSLASLTRRRIGVSRTRDRDTAFDRSGAEPSRSIVLESLLRGLVPLLLAFSLYLLAAGHNAPGGGFTGGLVAAAAVALRAIDGAWRHPRDRPRWLQPQPLIGAGLAVAALTLVSGWVWGAGFADLVIAKLDLPVLGSVKLTSALLLDVGVYLTVLGAVIAILDGLAVATEDVPAPGDLADGPAPSAGGTVALDQAEATP